MEFFKSLNKDTMHLVEEFYQPEAVLVDPLGRIEGSKRIRAYYEYQYKNASAISWDIGRDFVSGNEVSFYWTMNLSARGLNGGKAFSVDGMSRFVMGEGGRVSFHQDYFDAGAFLYEKIPVLRNVVDFVKSQMKKGLKDFDASQ
jgi:hypothetical protein